MTAPYCTKPAYLTAVQLWSACSFSQLATVPKVSTWHWGKWQAVSNLGKIFVLL